MIFLYFLIGLMTLLGVILGMMVIIPLVGRGRPGESQQALACLGEAVGLGRVGEEVAGGEDEPSSPFEEAGPLPRRQIIRWLDGNTVLATTRHRRLFYGEVLGRSRRNELLLRRERGCPIRVRQPQ